MGGRDLPPARRGEELPAKPGAFDAARSAAMLVAVVQGAALHWLRKRPELVMAVVLASGVGYQLIVPEVVMRSRACSRSARWRRPGSIGALPEQRA
ncbi:MAG TPA: hypothetical protein VG126_13225 [Thermoleophilaceae bacterium]|nr:hypothetical protein [Thermoleophilaceae bacterium]